MSWLIAGLVIFLGMHSLRIVGEAPRTLLIGRLGENVYKAAYSIVSLSGLFLIWQGYHEAQAEGGTLYAPRAGFSHLALVLVPISFVLVAAAYGPAGHIKRIVRHPMTAGVAIWALGHLLANGLVADAILFGAFLVWAIVDYFAALHRNPNPVSRQDVTIKGDGLAIVIGLALSALFISGLHAWLFGVSPLG